jgi:hypothetical protein
VAVEPTAARHSRRAILGAALGGAAAAAAGAIAAPATALADTGGNAVLGQANTADAATSFENTTAGGTSLTGLHGGNGTGVSASSVDGPGIWAVSTDATPSDFETVDPSRRSAIYATVGDATDAATVTDETAVYGFSDISANSYAVVGHSHLGTGVGGFGPTGVFGFGFYGVYAGGRMAVVGDADVDGTGVYGNTGPDPAPDAPAGVGVYARAASTAQTALQVVGKVKLSRSGRTSVASTATVKKVTMAGVTTNSYVVATLQSNVAGVYVRAVTCGTGYFNIWLSKAPGKTVVAAYVVIN